MHTHTHIHTHTHTLSLPLSLSLSYTSSPTRSGWLLPVTSQPQLVVACVSSLRARSEDPLQRRLSLSMPWHRLLTLWLCSSTRWLQRVGLCVCVYVCVCVCVCLCVCVCVCVKKVSSYMTHPSPQGREFRYAEVAWTGRLEQTRRLPYKTKITIRV